MEWLHLALLLAGSGFVIYPLCRMLRLSRGQTVACVAVAVGGTLAMAIGYFFVAFGECLAENRYPEPPLSWPWSPRREFCQSGTWASRGTLALLLIPTLVACGGAVLFRFKWRVPAYGVLALVVATPFLPGLYVSLLPYYRLDSYAILHNPYVRPESEEAPARACYAYGIVHGPKSTAVTDGSERVCADLARTPESAELVPEYESLPNYATVRWRLEWLGKRLTEEEMAPGTAYDGLIAERVYRLSESRPARTRSSPGPLALVRVRLEVVERDELERRCVRRLEHDGRRDAGLERLLPAQATTHQRSPGCEAREHPLRLRRREVVPGLAPRTRGTPPS